MTSSPRAARMRSLDIFRGFTIAGMILVNNPGSEKDTYPFLCHAPWNGWTFADIIFPFFLWIAGVSMTLSTASRVSRGEDRRVMLAHGVRRSLWLFIVGVLLMTVGFGNPHFPFLSFASEIRLTGILQKIAVCYLVSFVVFLWADWRGVVAAIVGLNALYLGLMFFYPVPWCGAGGWTPGCNFARYLDELLLKGHTWHQATQDPDGLGSILPAISSVLMGVLAGYVMRANPEPRLRTVRLIALGGALVLAGAVVSIWVPINKPLWTTSYALLMAGLATLGFAASYWICDVKGHAEKFKPLEIFGMNAIAAFIVSVVVSHLPKEGGAERWLLHHVWQRIASPANASLLGALAFVLGMYLVAWFMYRRRWFLKF